MMNQFKHSIGWIVAAAALCVSCSPPVQQQQPPPTPSPAQQPLPLASGGTPESPAVGVPAVHRARHIERPRYKLVTTGDSSEGSVLYLLDTKDGGTWIYRPPSPPAFNGFWSDIPRLTYPPETWQQVFQQMASQASTSAQPPAAPPSR